MEFTYWPHPADAVTIGEVVGNEETTVKVYTDGSKKTREMGPA